MRFRRWNVAMLMLQNERSVYAAQRQGWRDLRLRNLSASLGGAASEVTRTAIGNAWLLLQTRDGRQRRVPMPLSRADITIVRG